jgi:LysM repeat protein
MCGSRLWLNVVLVVFVVLLAAAPGAALAAPAASSTASAPASSSASTSALSTAITNGAPSSFGAGPACEYRVRWGDTLANIAWRYHTSATYLARLNDIRNPNHITAGRWLSVPCLGHAR